MCFVRVAGLHIKSQYTRNLAGPLIGTLVTTRIRIY